MLPLLVSALEWHGHLKLDETVRSKVLSASPATIDRILASTRLAAGGDKRKRAKAVPGIRRTIPVRTFADWKEPAPGYMEADLVAHCGGIMEGSFVHSFVLTDIASGWTECIALVVRSGSLIAEAMERLRTTMPFPLRGFDTDNGGEFINDIVIAYCKEKGIEFTRSRPYQKNDQAWVEQKNGSIVRRLVGYRRLEGIAAAEALARLYTASRLFVNFFQPSFRLAEKTRVGARVHKRYHSPKTPCARLLERDEVQEGMKERLKEIAFRLDPLKLLDEIRSAQCELVRVADGDNTSKTKQSTKADLDQFLEGLSTAWQQGEVRPTHRLKTAPRRNWRTRRDPFEAVWPKVCGWIENTPDHTAKELFHRLQEEHPDVFPDKQLRTLQRRIKEWRAIAARRLVFGDLLKIDDIGHVGALVKEIV
jgi:hypothetical protein